MILSGEEYGMDRLTYKVLSDQQYNGYILKEAPEKILQFGEGNFLRAFADCWVDLLNERAGFNGKVVVVQPIPSGRGYKLNEQEGLYTLYLRGQENGQKVCRKRVISAVSRCIDPYTDFNNYMKCADNPDLRFIISNTTEAGIVYDPECKLEDRPAGSFPGKLTQLLYRRFKRGEKGFIIFSCELIDHNGDELKKCVHAYTAQWNLETDFNDWIDRENEFCSTLVDRIVPGYPQSEAKALWKELGYEDDSLVTAEVYGFWVIEGPDSIKNEFPVDQAKLPIITVRDHTPYKQRKVRILNGAHTSFVLGAYLAGENIVRDCMKNKVIQGFMNKTIYQEIIPTLDLDRKDLDDFAAAVSERFSNPYIDHQLLSIALNSTSKWKARCMPSLLEYSRRNDGRLPACLTFSFAAYLKFYHNGTEKGNGCLNAVRGNDTYSIRDDQWVLDFFYEHRKDDNRNLAHAVIQNNKMWGAELSGLSGFEEAVTADMKLIDEKGMFNAMKEIQQ